MKCEYANCGPLQTSCFKTASISSIKFLTLLPADMFSGPTVSSFEAVVTSRYLARDKAPSSSSSMLCLYGSMCLQYLVYQGGLSPYIFLQGHRRPIYAKSIYSTQHGPLEFFENFATSSGNKSGSAFLGSKGANKGGNACFIDSWSATPLCLR